MDVQTLVKTVIRTFEDAASLVRRIQNARDASDAPALPEEPTIELLNSLALGPMIIRGHFDHDQKRFGEAYGCGDIQAREQLKDVLINLQITLISGLNQVWMDNGDIDFNEMQSVSDESRVNAGVSLGQLSQRLSDAKRAQSAYSSQASPYSSGAMLQVSSPLLHYSSSQSTNSSNFSRAHAITANSLADDMSKVELTTQSGNPPLRDEDGALNLPTSQEEGRMPSTQRYAPAPLHIRDRRSISSGDALSVRRPSSHCLAPGDAQLLSPSASAFERSAQPSLRQHPVQSNEQDRPSPGFGSQETSPQLSRASSTVHYANNARHSSAFTNSRPPSQTATSDFPSYSTHWEARQAQLPVVRQPYRDVTGNDQDYSTKEHVQYLQKTARPPMTDFTRIRTDPRPYFREPLSEARKPPHHGVQRIQQHSEPPSSQIPTEWPSISGPISLNSPRGLPTPTARSPPLEYSPSSYSASLQTSKTPGYAPSITPSSIHLTPLTLPTEKSTLGFCKGAIRLFLTGIPDKKSFSIYNRPIGISGVLPYWRCEKCSFEGPCVTSAPLPGQKRSKAEKTFDLRVRDSGGAGGAGVGIQYRWVFLAKSHVCMKTAPELGTAEQRRGEYGSFGCLFCACEAGRRGWALSGCDIYTDTSTATSGGGSEEGSGTGGKLKLGWKKDKDKDRDKDSGSVRSSLNGGGSATGGSGGGTPIFGNVASFMEHLQVHRREEMQPGVEMMGRVKGIAGRVPEPGEECDVAFLPL